MSNLNWTDWKPVPSPENCRAIDGPDGSGVYQIRNKIKKQNKIFNLVLGYDAKPE